MALKTALKVVPIIKVKFNGKDVEIPDVPAEAFGHEVIKRDGKDVLLKLIYDEKDEGKLGTTYKDAADFKSKDVTQYNKLCKVTLTQEMIAAGIPDNNVPLVDGVEFTLVREDYEAIVQAANAAAAAKELKP